MGRGTGGLPLHSLVIQAPGCSWGRQGQHGAQEGACSLLLLLLWLPMAWCPVWGKGLTCQSLALFLKGQSCAIKGAGRRSGWGKWDTF